jgi:hypothetical protein
MSSKYAESRPTPAEVPADPNRKAQIRALQRGYVLLLGWIADQGHPEVIGDLVDSLRRMEHKLRVCNHDNDEVAALRELADLIEQATRPRTEPPPEDNAA